MPFRRAPRNPHAVLTIEGECARPTAFTYHDLEQIHTYYQVEDLATVDRRLSGKGVRLRKLIDLAGPTFHTRHLVVESEDGRYSASLPLDETSRTAVIVYADKGKPLSRDDGGPVRFVIPYSGDRCANVKGATRIVISETPGKDTRPHTPEQHAALHEDG